jgi:hypothetical protein
MNKMLLVLAAVLAYAAADGGASAGGYGAMTVGSAMAHGANYGAMTGGYAGGSAAHVAHATNYGSTLGHMAAMGTAASFSGPLAVLGLLKIGAAAFMALNYFRAQNEREQYGYGYGYDQQQPHHYRHKRSAEDSMMESNPESYFTLVNSMDSYGCGKQLICELEAKSQREDLEGDEKLMISLFG